MMSNVIGGGIYQIRNEQTNKCLTIAGGTSTNNNLTALHSTATPTCRVDGWSR